MNKIKTEIWGRVLELDVVFDRYSGEDVLDSQKAALTAFLDRADILYSIALEKVKCYCLENNGSDIEENVIGNIFKYVKPKALYVGRSNDERIVAILCAYKFNPDDGLAIVFKNEMFSRIGTENIVI